MILKSLTDNIVLSILIDYSFIEQKYRKYKFKPIICIIYTYPYNNRYT